MPQRHDKKRVGSPFRGALIATCVGLGTIVVTACAGRLPSVEPFAEGTADLYQAHDREADAVIAQYERSIDLARALATARPSPLDPAQAAAVDTIVARLSGAMDRFANWDRLFSRVMRAAVDYSDALVALTAAGESGSEAAESLAGTLNQFGDLTGVGEVLTGPVASAISSIGDIATRIQAQGSLREATDAAQPAVDTLAALLREIHEGSLQTLVTALASDADVLLLYDAGPAIAGYYRQANARRHLYYRRALLTLQLNDDGISGFCRDPTSGEIDETCINLRELEALREVEERLRFLTPEMERYETERQELAEWLRLRRANGARIVDALEAWVEAHQSVRRALATGTGMNALSLRAILAEIDSIR